MRRKEGSVNPHGERLAFLIGQAVERIQQVGQPRRGGLDPEAADTLLAETVADLEAALTVRVRRLKLEGKQQEARQVADQAWDVVADLETQRARIKSLSRRKVRTRGTSETGTTPTKYARPRAAELASPAGDVHRPDFTFYGALPGPWAQPPQRRYRSCRQATDALKFDGKAESYVGWRTGFLIATHRTTEPVDWKMLQLVKSIQEAAKSDHHLQRILQLSEYSETTYAMAIEILENQFGDREEISFKQVEAIRALKCVREGDERTIGMLDVRLRGHISFLRSTAAEDPEANPILYQICMKVLADDYRLKYLGWTQDSRRERGVRSLLLWLGRELERFKHSRVYAQAIQPKPSRTYVVRQDSGAGPPRPTTGQTTKLSPCTDCTTGKHGPSSCAAFAAATIKVRRIVVREGGGRT